LEKQRNCLGKDHIPKGKINVGKLSVTNRRGYKKGRLLTRKLILKPESARVEAS